MKRLLIALVILSAAACGDDGGTPGADAGLPNCVEAGGASCFIHPTVSTTADAPGGEAPANWACPPETITMSANPVDVSGRVNDFQEGSPLVGATVEAFLDARDLSTPVATATTNAMGDYMFTIPMGSPSRMNWRITHPDALDTYEINDPIDVSGTSTTADRNSVSQLTAAALPAFIGVQRTPGLGVLAGAVRDCNRDPVAHAIATISSTSSAGDVAPQFVPGAQVYYFSNMDPDLPVKRNLREDTNLDGLFVIIEIPPTTGTQTYFLQIWGYEDAAQVATGNMSLLSEFETIVKGDSVIVVDMDPTEGQ